MGITPMKPAAPRMLSLGPLRLPPALPPIYGGSMAARPLPSLWRRPSPRTFASATLLALVLGSLALAFELRSFVDIRPGPNEFSTPAWETKSFLQKWLYGFGRIFRPAL